MTTQPAATSTRKSFAKYSPESIAYRKEKLEVDMARIRRNVAGILKARAVIAAATGASQL